MVESQGAANATRLDNAPSNATTDLFTAAVGPLHTGYYVPIFSAFDASDRTAPRWNWAAGVLTLNWLILRRLWGAALAYVGAVLAAMLLVTGIARLVFGLSPQAQTAGLLLVAAASVCIPGAFGNVWFYKACRRKMAVALAANAALEDACAMLLRQAATRRQAIVLGIANALLVAAVVGVVLAFQSVMEASARSGVKASQAALANRNLRLSPADTSATLRPNTAVAATTSAPAMPAPMGAASAVIESQDSAAVVAPPSATPQKARPTAAASTTSGKRFLVDLGVFGNENSALAAAQTVESAGFSALLNDINLPRGRLTRLRAGVFDSEPQARQAVTTLRRLGLRADVAMLAATPTNPLATVPLPNTPTARPQPSAAPATAKVPVRNRPMPTTSAATTGEYVVNVGVFADSNNARNAAAQLEDAGIAALVNALKSRKGPRTQVRAGPFASEAEAQRAAEAIQRRGLEAVVVRR